MKKFLAFIALPALLLAATQYFEPMQIKFDNRLYSLAGSAKPVPNLFTQEYLLPGEKIDSFSISVGNTKLAPYAKFVYFGTRPHVIKPKKMKALANKKSGQIFGKRVNHPGTKANPYLEKAFSEYVSSASFEKAKEQLAKDIGDETVKFITSSINNIK